MIIDGCCNLQKMLKSCGQSEATKAQQQLDPVAWRRGQSLSTAFDGWGQLHVKGHGGLGGQQVTNLLHPTRSNGSRVVPQVTFVFEERLTLTRR